MTSPSAQTARDSTSQDAGQSSGLTASSASEQRTATAQTHSAATDTRTTAPKPQVSRIIPYLPAEVMDTILNSIDDPVDKENFIKAYRPGGN